MELSPGSTPGGKNSKNGNKLDVDSAGESIYERYGISFLFSAVIAFFL